MNVYDTYNQQHQYYNQQQPIYNQYYNQPSGYEQQNMLPYNYQLNEVLYVDHAATANLPNIGPNYREQLYSYDQSAYIPNNGYPGQFYAYNPVNNYDSNNNGGHIRSDNSIDSILKRNTEVWKAYKSGNFSVKEDYVNGIRKIILKEKSESYVDDSEYSVKRYKVRISRRRGAQNNDDDHILLISYSNNALSNVTPPQIAHSGAYATNNAYPTQYAGDQAFSGPGLELVARLIEGTETLSPVNSLVGISPDTAQRKSNSGSSSRRERTPSRSSYDDSKQVNVRKGRVLGQSRLSGSVRKALQTFDDDDESIMSPSASKSKIIASRSSKMSSNSRSTPATTPRLVASGTPSTPSVAKGASSSRHTASSQYDNQSTSKADLAESTSKEDMDKVSDRRVSSRVSNNSDSDNSKIEKKSNSSDKNFYKNDQRSAIRNTLSQVEPNMDAISLGPGSTAGGSLYGDSNYDHAKQSQINNDAKSAFSEYSLAREDEIESKTNSIVERRSATSKKV